MVPIVPSLNEAVSITKYDWGC